MMDDLVKVALIWPPFLFEKERRDKTYATRTRTLFKIYH